MGSEELIEGIPLLTKTWLENVIEKKVGRRPKVALVCTLSDSVMGYMSVIRRVKLSWDDESSAGDVHLPKSVVVKVVIKAPSKPEHGEQPHKVVDMARGNEVMNNACDGDHNTDMDVIQNNMHDTECSYYNLFKRYDEKPFPVPVVYTAMNTHSDVPAIVMEDFGDCSLVDLIDGFNEAQLYQIVDMLVQIHYFSLSTEAWKTAHDNNDAVRDMFKGFVEQIKTIGFKLAKNPELAIVKEFIERMFEEDDDFVFKFAEIYEKGERPSVLCHGDLWSPQILWGRDGDISGIIDWQIAHRGNATEDLLRVLSTCTSVDNRRRLQKPLLDHYHRELTRRLTAKGIPVPYTREELDEEYRFAMRYVCYFTIFANGFWANSPVLQTDEKPDPERTSESFSRCRAFVEDTMKAWNWS